MARPRRPVNHWCDSRCIEAALYRSGRCCILSPFACRRPRRLAERAGHRRPHHPLHRDLRKGPGVHPRVQAARVPRPAAHGRHAEGRRLAARGHRRHLLHPARHPARRPAEGRQPPGAHARARPHRRARRLRRRDGRAAARAPADPRHGRDHRAVLPRQARHAREGAQPGRAGPRVRAHGQRRSGPPVRRGRARAVDAQAALECRGHRHLPHRADRRPVAGARRARRSAVVLPARALRAKATSSTSTRWSGSAR